MLSAFTARPIIELKPRDKSKIETILANGTYHSPLHFTHGRLLTGFAMSQATACSWA